MQLKLEKFWAGGMSSKLIIRPGTVADVDAVQVIANDAKTLPFLGGFTMRDQLIGLYQANEKFPYHVVAELDGQVVGFSDSKNKNLSYTEYDLVAIKTDLRRQRIGTAMYTYHLLKSAMAGKVFMRDQTIHFNTVMQDGYLPYFGFDHIAGLRSKVRNFSTLNWWIKYISEETMVDFTKKTLASEHKVVFQGLEEAFGSCLLDEFNRAIEAVEDPLELSVLADNRSLALALIQGLKN